MCAGVVGSSRGNVRDEVLCIVTDGKQLLTAPCSNWCCASQALEAVCLQCQSPVFHLVAHISSALRGFSCRVPSLQVYSFVAGAAWAPGLLFEGVTVCMCTGAAHTGCRQTDQLCAGGAVQLPAARHCSIPPVRHGLALRSCCPALQPQGLVLSFGTCTTAALLSVLSDGCP